jgi:hypothetical protein
VVGLGVAATSTKQISPVLTITDLHQVFKSVKPLSFILFLSEGIAGEPIDSKETLFIEADVPALGTQVEEVLDSEEDGEDGIEYSEDGEDDVEPAPARSLRQLSLLNMFRPRE